jgi:tetratricopeptide (TPR) repeat protein
MPVPHALRRLAPLFALLFLCALPLRAADNAALLKDCDAACAKFDLNRSQSLAAQALAAKPGDFESMWRLVRAQVDLGEDSQDKGQDAQAESWFNKALASSKDLVAKHPQQSMAHYYRALALGRRALFAGSKEAVQLSQEVEREALQALKLDPKNGRAHGLIGRYYREMAHLSWVKRKLAETLFGKLPEGGDAKALQHLKQATQLEPNWVFAWYELGETHEVMGQTAEARKAFQKAASLPKADHRDDRLKADAARQ